MAIYQHHGLPGGPTNAWPGHIGPTYMSATGTLIIYGHGSGFETRLTGTFTVDGAGVVSAGTITGMQRTNIDGSIVYEAITNIGNVPVMNFINQAQSTNKMASVMTGADTLNGHSGQDILRGFGEVDTFNGGGGSDLYIIENAGEIINEATDGGDSDAIDTTLSSYTLGANIEHLTFIGAGSFSGTGNALNNIIRGGASGDVLTGAAGIDELIGGGGADSMDGGADNDTYHVDNLLDFIADASGASDRVYAFISGITLADGIEAYSYFGAGGAVASGNALDNSFTGGGGDDEFFGLDGNDSFFSAGGDDTFHGGAGHDNYYINSATDVVDEAMSGGTDTIYAPLASYTLGANVENLYHYEDSDFIGNGNGDGNAMGALGGDDQLFGLAGMDSLYGGGGDDELFGGGDSDTLEGEDGDDILSGGLGADTLNGSAGIDTVDYSASVSGVTVSLAFGTNSGGDAQDDTILDVENITGSDHDDLLIGNGDVNILVGGDGADNLDGNGGLDTLDGGGGDDEYYLASGFSTIIDSDGVDTIVTTVDRSLAGYLTIENLMLGVGGNLNLAGNGLDNVLTGNTDNNILAGGAGADTLNGSLGNDTYVLTDQLDTIIEAGGIDRIESTANVNLGEYAGIENLTLTAGDINGAGSVDDNLIIGSAGKNFLIGGGGADVLRGMAGNDIYGIDSADDVVDEAGGGGIDSVKSLISLSLANTATTKGNVENLELVGAAANGTGNALDNVLTGNAFVNVLYGGLGHDTLIGGLGIDIARGGKGNDKYVVDAKSEVVDEAHAGGNGIDTVHASASFSLVKSATLLGDVERLTLTGAGNTSATGNALANILTGNTGNNIMTGGAGNDSLNGGKGADSMRGGIGNDVYVVDSTKDVVVEAGSAAGGLDRVVSSVSANLANTAQYKGTIETLTLTGTGKINGFGNAADNVIVGNAGANILRGMAGNDRIGGGLGIDTLSGGLGNDRFVFKTAAESKAGAAADRITDFDDLSGNDAIDLSGLIPGELAFVGASGFTGINQVRIRDLSGPDVLVEINLAGNATPEMAIRLTATTAASMGADDFIL